MPKAISVPPPIPKEAVPKEGTTATIKTARIVRNQWTSIGVLTLGLGLTVELLNGEYNQLFSLDKDPITGSAGRIMCSVGLEEVNDDISDEDVKVLIGKKYTVKNRGGKLYWYP